MIIMIVVIGAFDWQTLCDYTTTVI